MSETFVVVIMYLETATCLCNVPDATPSLVSSLAPSRGPRGTFHREYRRRFRGESCGELGMALLCTPSLGSADTSPGAPSNIWWVIFNCAQCSWKIPKTVSPEQELYGSECLARHGSLHMAPKRFCESHLSNKFLVTFTGCWTGTSWQCSWG